MNADANTNNPKHHTSHISQPFPFMTPTTLKFEDII